MQGSECNLSRGGVLTDKMVYGDAQRFEVHFRKFWYIDGWVMSHTQCAQFHNLKKKNCKIGCILENLALKSTYFATNWVLFAEKWYRDGSQNHAFRGIEMVEILKLSIPV